MNAEGDWLAPLQARLSMESSIHVDPWWTVAETNRLGGCFVFDFELSHHFCNYIRPHVFVQVKFCLINRAFSRLFGPLYRKKCRGLTTCS